MRAATTAWATDSPRTALRQAPKPEPVETPAVVDLADSEVEAEAARLSTDLQTARAERDDLARDLAEAQASLAGAASRGLEAARKAQGTISETEGRLRVAGALADALERALAPIAEQARRVYLVRVRDQFAARHQAILATRDAVDLEVVEAVRALAAVANRREIATAAALAIESEARTSGVGPIGSAERGYHGSPVKAAVEAIAIPLRVTIGG